MPETPSTLDLDGDGSPFTPDDVELCRARTITMRARPAPAWDEEAIRAARDEYVRHNLGMAVGTYGDRLRCAFEAGVDAVRDRLPVKPDREALAQKAFEAAGRDDWGVANDLERDEWLDVADAVLDLLPGRSEAEVKAEGAVEALREVAARYRHHDAQGYLYVSHEDLAQVPWETVARDLDVSADRLAAEGGAGRG